MEVPVPSSILTRLFRSRCPAPPTTAMCLSFLPMDSAEIQLDHAGLNGHARAFSVCQWVKDFGTQRYPDIPDTPADRQRLHMADLLTRPARTPNHRADLFTRLPNAYSYSRPQHDKRTAARTPPVLLLSVLFLYLNTRCMYTLPPLTGFPDWRASWICGARVTRRRRQQRHAHKQGSGNSEESHKVISERSVHCVSTRWHPRFVGQWGQPQSPSLRARPPG